MNMHLNVATHWGRLQNSLVRREEVMTVVVTLCGILAVLSGVAWCFIKEDSLLYLYLSLHVSYLIGQKYWKFKDGTQAAEAKRAPCKGPRLRG